MNSLTVYVCAEYKPRISTENKKKKIRIDFHALVYMFKPKLKCHTSAYNLYDVYVTGMFLSPSTAASSYMMKM